MKITAVSLKNSNWTSMTLVDFGAQNKIHHLKEGKKLSSAYWFFCATLEATMYNKKLSVLFHRPYFLELKKCSQSCYYRSPWSK